MGARARYADRADAGRALAGALLAHRALLGGSGTGGAGLVVLGLPRGGVPVAAPVAAALGADLDVLVVRKLGVPWQPELAMGAVAGVGEQVVVVRDGRVLAGAGVAEEDFARVRDEQLAVLAGLAAVYRGGAPAVPVRGRTAVLVEDGAATESSARAAVHRPAGGRAPAAVSGPLPEGLRAGRVVLDASYVISLLDKEEVAQAFAPLLARSLLPSLTAGEVFSKLHAASGVEPDQVEAGLVALGVELVDLPVAAARHFHALRALDAARCAEQRTSGERPVQTLSLADLCILVHALHTRLPVLTGAQHWATLRRHGLAVNVHLFRPGAL